MLPHLMSYTMLANNHLAELERHTRSARVRSERATQPARVRTSRLLRYLNLTSR